MHQDTNASNDKNSMTGVGLRFIINKEIEKKADVEMIKEIEKSKANLELVQSLVERIDNLEG